MIKKIKMDIVSDKSLNEIYNILDQYYSNLKNLYYIQKNTPENYADILLAISSGYDFLDDKELWKEFGYQLCLNIKKEIENFPPYIYHLGITAGFGNICFSVNSFVEKTGILSTFSNSLNLLLLSLTDKYLQNISDYNGTDMDHYDLVFGLSGILNYLLEFQWDVNQRKILEKIVVYLVELSQDYTYQGKNLIRYHIPAELQKRELEKTDLPNGHINFGVAHGMAGPLLALSKAYYHEYSVDGLKEAIDKIFHIYDSFKVYTDNTVRWPTQLSVEDYLEQKYNDIYRPNFAGWCYGNLGTAAALYTASKYIKDTEKIIFYKQQLSKIINRNVKEYRLFKISICHGYSGMLFTRMTFFNELNDNEFIKTLEMQVSFMLDILKQYKSDEGIYNFDRMKELFDGEALFLTDLSGVIIAFLEMLGKTKSIKLLLGLE